MISPGNVPRNISFRVETLFFNKGGRVGRVVPSASGVYSGMPLMVIGQTTQQNTYYDPKSVMDQITNPESRFNKVFSQQKLYGEYGHPSFLGMAKEDQLQRLCTVDERNVSHLFTSFYTDKPSADGTVVLRGDIKPTGPMGAVFKESLDDPMVNTSFSLRAYVNTDVGRDGIKYRTVRSLTTFDVVGASGFSSTDKAHSLGLESFAGEQYDDYEIKKIENGNLLIDQIALETYSNTDLNEIFGVSSISKIVQSRTLVESDKSLQEKFPTLYAKSVFHELIKGA